MGLGNWLDKKLGIRFDSRTLGNLTKNVAPVAGTLVGGPAGLALAGGLGAAGELGRGKNIGEAARAGLSSAGQAGIGMAAKGGLAKLAGKGVSSVPTGGGALANAATAPIPTGGLATTVAGPSPYGALDIAKGVGGMAKDAVGSVAGGVLDFAKANPNAAAGALSAVGNLASAGSENRVRNANAGLLESQLEETEYEKMRQRQRMKELDPAFAGLGTALGQGLNGQNVAANPYLPRR